MIDPRDLARAFATRFGRAPRIHRAPGRVNLIGEHTDYNDGFVMPMALDRSTWVAAAPRQDRTMVVHSEDVNDTVTFDLDGEAPTGWSRYVYGVAALLDRELSIRGAAVHGSDLLIASDVPIGAGLSSSAALEVSCAAAFLDLAAREMDPLEMARLCQRAEHAFAGTRCGIMDQMIACCGREGHAMRLDTRTLERAYLPMPPTVRVLVCNTMVRHELASGEYNRRRADCEAGVAALQQIDPAIRALRDATLGQLDAIREGVSATVHRRCHHVITENDRVECASDALARGDFAAFGALMAASHASLRDDYNVSCDELDVMVDVVSELDGVFGARMTGGGFGGCVVALVEAASVGDAQSQTIRDRYEARCRKRPDVWVTSAGRGVSTWSPG